MAPPVSLWTLFGVFFRIACTSFGGFMALISMVQNVVVERRKLMSSHDMLDGISLASILPGPVAVNLVAYVGYKLRGGLGALVSAFAVVLPSFVFILILSIAYFRWGQVPAVSKLFMGFLPAVTAIIAAAAWNMSRKAIVGAREAVIAAAAAAVLLGIGGFLSTLAIILGAGIAGWLLFRGQVSPSAANPPPAKPKSAGLRAYAGLTLLAAAPISTVVPLLSFESGLLLKLFLTFAGMSLMLFGGAYVFIPLIQETVVQGHGWVTQQEFIDAVAMGQITPGPILVSAAFIGFKIAGLAGAVVATLGIYLPSGLLMIVCTHVLDRIKRAKTIQAALRGIRPAVIGMIFAAAVVIGMAAAPAWVSVVIFVAALLALLRWRVDVIWIIPPAGIAGLLLY
ncbi:MAG: chromate efflux transporter [Gammaproteobacteria bacterium]|nr:chromate efflux transporter [Gammaproteobacteria bacterium]